MTISYECDRCHRKAIFMDNDDKAGWEYNYATDLTLCPHCVWEYRQFMQGNTGTIPRAGGKMTIIASETKQDESFENYLAELKRAVTIRDKRIVAADAAYLTAAEKAYEKYKAAGGE